MDYEKKYKDAQKWIESIYSELSHEQQMEAEAFFPELKESEDEKIRKRIIHALHGDVLDMEETTKAISWLEKQCEPQDKGEISDGYHTFNELYYYRMLYNAAFFNMLPKEWVHKSKKHHDGEDCFGGGWFIVMANLPTGQISNHYELKDWDLFQIPEKERADKWDGHTPQEAAERLHKFLLENQGEQKPADKVEPKFHEGDWITCEELNTALIVNIVDDKYEVEFVDGNKGFPHIDYVDRLFHLWTIKDAKDGDVLQLGNVTAIFQEYIGSGNCKCYCSVYNGEFEIPSQDNSYGCHNAIPATKEQRDILFAKMKEIGYEWGADKKELKKISQRIVSAEAKEALYDKPAWSEEDYTMIEAAINLAHEYGRHGLWVWLKSLKDRVQPKQEWSEEDEEFLRRAINVAKDKYPMTANWLKSLKERYIWKPSAGQMKALHDLNLTGNISYAGQGQILIELYNDLKKLTE